MNGKEKKVSYQAPTYIKVYNDEGNFEMCGLTDEIQVEQLTISLKKRLEIQANEKCYVFEVDLQKGKESKLGKKDKPLKIMKKWKNPNHHQFLIRFGDKKKPEKKKEELTVARKISSNSSLSEEDNISSREKFFSVVGSPNYMAAGLKKKHTFLSYSFFS